MREIDQISMEGTEMNQWQSFQQSTQENYRYHADKAAEKARKYEARAVRSAQKKAKLAERIDDDPMLIAGIRFYVEELRSNHIFNFEEIFEKHRKMPRKVRHYLTAARRILGIRSNLRNRIFALPKNWRNRLFKILDLDVYPGSDASVEFARLRADLVIDEAVRTFAERHPILEAAKSFLLEGLAKRPLPQKPPTPYETVITQRLSSLF